MDKVRERKIAETLCARLWESGFTAYLVGGCVRDMVMGKIPHDYDICTSALPEQTEAVFCDYTVLKTGMRHGTVTVVCERTPFEITTYRRDGAYSDGRHPDCVSFCSEIGFDLSRRDFTMNAMATYAGEWLDPFFGRADIQNRIIRAVGVADERMQEDALRILRALRFAARLGFCVEAHTAAAMRRYQALLSNISVERIASELIGFLQGEHIGSLLVDFRSVFSVFLKSVQNKENILTIQEEVKRYSPADWVFRLAVLLGEECAEEDLVRLKFANAVKDEVLFLLREREAFLAIDCAEKMIAFVIRCGRQRAERMLAFLHQPKFYTELYRAIRQNPLTLKELSVNGSDLTAIGLQGKEVSLVLQKLLYLAATGQTENSKERLLSAVDSVVREIRDGKI